MCVRIRTQVACKLHFEIDAKHCTANCMRVYVNDFKNIFSSFILSWNNRNDFDLLCFLTLIPHLHNFA